MDFSEAIRETREGIFLALNRSGLPIDAMDLLLGDIRAEIHDAAETQYRMLIDQRKKAAEIKPEAKEQKEEETKPEAKEQKAE